MQAEEKTKTKHRKRTARRIVKWILAVVVVLLVLVILVVPVFISSGSFRRFILAKINSSVAGRTDFADLSMGWLKGVKVADFSFDDDAGQISVKVKQIATKPHYASILAGNLSFGQTTIDEPKVEINLKDKPPTGNVTDPQPAPVPIEVADIALVTDVVINDGSVKITDSQARTAELSKINSKISLRPPGKQSTFDLNVAVFAKGSESKIHVDGHVTPTKTKTKSGWTLKDSDGDLTIEIDDLDIESLEPFLELAGIDAKAKGAISANIKSEIRDGQIANLEGKVRGSRLDVTVAELKGDRLQTTALDADIKLTRKEQMIRIDQLTMKTDWADLNATGSVPTTLKSLDSLLDPDSTSDLKGTFNCDLPVVASQMPNTLGLKEGTKITSGRFSGEVRTSTQAGRKQIKASAELADLKGTVGGKEVALSQPLQAHALISKELISKDKTVMKFDELNVSASFANVNCTGTTENLRYHADVDLAKLQSELGQFVDLGGYRMAGQLVETGQISIAEDKITADGAAQVKDLKITSPNDLTATEPKADIDFAIDIDRKENILIINTIKTGATFGTLSVKDAVIPLDKDANEPMNLTVSAAGVDLAKLRPFAVMFASFPQDKLLAGIAESEITVTSEKDTYKIVTEKTKIKNFEFGSPGKKPFKQPEVSLVADVEFNPVEEWRSIKRVELVGEKIKIKKTWLKQTTKDDKTKLEGALDLEYDWAAVGDAASGFLPRGLSLQGKRSTSINFVSEYPADKTEKLLANLTTNKCSLGFDRALYRGLDFGPTDLNAQFENGVLRIDPFSTTVSSGQIKFAANADFTRDSTIIQIPQPISIQGVRINETLSREFRGLLAYLNPMFKDFIGLSGGLNFSAEKLVMPLDPERRNDIQIVGTFGMDNVSLRPAGLLGQIISLIGESPQARTKIHPTDFTVRDGFVRYDNMQVDIGSTPVNFKGAIGLDRSLDMMLGLPLGRMLRIGDERTGTRIWLPLTGTIDKPKLDTARLLEDQLQDTIKGLLDGLLK